MFRAIGEMTRRDSSNTQKEMKSMKAKALGAGDPMPVCPTGHRWQWMITLQCLVPPRAARRVHWKIRERACHPLGGLAGVAEGDGGGGSASERWFVGCASPDRRPGSGQSRPVDAWLLATPYKAHANDRPLTQFVVPPSSVSLPLPLAVSSTAASEDPQSASPSACPIPSTVAPRLPKTRTGEYSAACCGPINASHQCGCTSECVHVM